VRKKVQEAREKKKKKDLRLPCCGRQGECTTSQTISSAGRKKVRFAKRGEKKDKGGPGTFRRWE